MSQNVINQIGQDQTKQLNIDQDIVGEQSQKQSASKIEQSLNRLRNRIEQVYTESREGYINRLKMNEDEMQKKYSINSVINNDTSELQKIGYEKITKNMNDISKEIIQSTQQMDCYVIKEKLRQNYQNQDDKDLFYRQQIEIYRKKNEQLQYQILQKIKNQKKNIIN